jgi:hypothetical protein
MTITAGVLSKTALSDTSVQVTSTAPTGGTGPYTQQLYMSTVPGFTPGGGNLVAGATALVNLVTGLIPNTTYYFEMIYTDSLSAVADSAQLSQVTQTPKLNPNQFALLPYLGVVDLPYNYDTVAVQIDVSQATPLYAGSAVKRLSTDSQGPYARSVPKVIGCTADTDQVMGFINYDFKSQSYVAGSRAEISMEGNVMYLYSTGIVAPNSLVTLDLTTNGGVAGATGSSANRVVGWAFDGASAAGQLIRVKIMTPSFTLDG